MHSKPFYFSLDCCPSIKTGVKQLKGVITWPSIAAGTNSTMVCPYKINGSDANNAMCLCRLDVAHSPVWSEPNLNECPYKTKTTRDLEKISQASTILFYQGCLPTIDLMNNVHFPQILL